MEQLAQKMARRATLPPLPKADVGGNYRAYYYVTDQRGYLDDEKKPMCRVQYMWLTCDESGWANAAQQMLRKSQTDRFVAWYESAEGQAITEKHGSVIASHMRYDVQEEIIHLFPVPGVDYKRPRTLPYLTPATTAPRNTAMTYIYRTDTKFGNYIYNISEQEFEWGFKLIPPADWESPLKLTPEKLEHLFNESQRVNFECWTHSAAGTEFFALHQDKLRELYSDNELLDAFGEVAKPLPLPVGADFDAARPYTLPYLGPELAAINRFCYLQSRPTEADATDQRSPKIEWTTETLNSAGAWDLPRLLAISQEPHFICWTYSAAGSRYLRENFLKILSGYTAMDVMKAFGEEAYEQAFAVQHVANRCAIKGMASI